MLRGSRDGKTVSVLGERAARVIDRRRLLSRGVRMAAGAVAASVALDAGGVARAVSPSLITCGCSPPRGVFCSGCPGSGGCPSGCAVCHVGDCGGCTYSSGYWVGCSGMGTCRNGFNYCYDCKCGSCSNTCGCGSNCICCGCCSPADLKREQAQRERLVAAHM